MAVDSIQGFEKKYSDQQDKVELNNLQKALREAVKEEKITVTPQSNQKQAMQLLANAQPQEAIRQTAQKQIDKDKGFDIKV